MEELDRPASPSRNVSPLFEPSNPSEPSNVNVAINDQPIQLPLPTMDSVVETMPNNLTSITREIKEEKEKSPILDGSQKRKAIDINSSDESGDEDDDGDDMVPPHVPDDEPLPQLPIYHPNIKTVQNNCMELVRRFEEKISNSTYHDDEMTYLSDMFSKLLNPPHETNLVQIGLVGDAGHGKSSTINSILGVDIADYGDDGDSCTCVVQEYTQASPTQVHPFMAEVFFFSRKACVDQIRDHFEMYFTYFTTSDDMDEEDLELGRLNSNTALTAFMALFQGHPEFDDKTSAEEFLQTASSVDDMNVVGRLVGWTEDILDQLLSDDTNRDHTCLNADTVIALKRMVEPFIKSVEYPSFEGTALQCSPWPLVKKVRFSFNSRVLEQKIVLGDCPGITDKNRLRVESTRRYLQNCDITIIVNKIDRAIDHASLYNNVNDAYRRGRSGSIIVVCTRSDDINMKGKQGFRCTIMEERNNARIDDEENMIDEHLKEVRASLKKTGLRGNLAKRLRLQSRKDRYERQKQELQRQRFEARVNARNRHVREGVSAQYHEDTKDPAQLSVFCVSNPVYMSHVSGFSKRSPPVLTLEGTGIPQLRNHIFSIPSNGKFKSLMHHCHTSLETALNTVQISCSTTKLKRKEDLDKTFQRARKHLKGNVQSIADRFIEYDVRVIFQIIIQSESKWIDQARHKCEKWAKLSPAGHRAVMKKGGTHGTKKTRFQNWNAELFDFICKDLDPPFEQIHNVQCDDLSRHIAERVGDTVDRLNTTLNVDPAASLSGAIGAFKKNLKERRNQIDRLCEQFKDSLKKEIRKIHARSCTGGEGHYFTEAMGEIYEQALEARKSPGSGSTLHAARCATFKKLLCSHNGAFMLIHRGIQDDFNPMFQAKISKLVAELDSIFAQIQHDVDQVCSTKEDDSPEGKAMREELLAMLPAAREFLREEIQKTLELCRDPKE